MTKKIYISLLLVAGISFSTQAQFGKLKGLVGGKKDTAQSVADTAKKVGKEKSGGSFFSKAIIKIAKASSGLVMSATGQLITTADLGILTPMVASSTNLYPVGLGTADMQFFNGWRSGGNLTTVFFTQKNKFGMAKIDGTVTIDGKPADYVSTGVYVSFTDASNKPSKVEVVTRSGQKSSFSIAPTPFAIKVKSINGVAGDHVPLDLTKDVVVELDVPAGAEHLPLHVKMAVNQIGIKAFYDVANFKGTSGKLLIPAAAFRNMNFSPGTKLLFNFKDSYLSVDRVQDLTVTDVSGVYEPFQYGAITQDGRYVDVTKEPVLNPGLTVKGTEKFNNGEVDYNFYKPVAYVSRPFDHIKKLGVISFSVRGTTYVQGKDSKSSSSYSVGGTTYTSTTTTTTWAQFPAVSDEVWAGTLASLYKDFTAAATQELSADVLPVSTITATEGYQSVSPFTKDDESTSVNFSHSYLDLKEISAYMPISEGYSSNTANMRIIKQSGANALMKFTFDMQIAIEGGKPVMIPKLGFEIVGENNGYAYGTKYCTATITGKGVRFPKNISVADMEQVIRKSDLLSTFRKGLQELKAKEIQNGDYKIVWDLQ
ncbi:MAG: hypothetical protein EOO88_24460 [Pedobacter sp.]|nr:MAG: hypothetical protein EOO88_24460 [Pedobacter sp.]